MDSVKAAARAYGAGQYDVAGLLCRQALARDPTDARATALLAAVENALGRHAAAATLFRSLCEREPTSPLHWANLGTALRATGEYDQALEAYHQAMLLGLKAPNFMLNVALLHIDRLELGRARTVLQNAAKAAPQHAEIRYFEAVCSFQEARNEDAQRTLTGWRELQEASADTLTGIGALLIQLGETAEAEAALREALAREPSHVQAGIRIAQLLERTNRLEAAQQQLASLDLEKVRGEENIAELLSMEARLAERQGDLARAAAKYRALLERTPSEHQRHHVLFPLARVLDLMGHYDETMTALAQAHTSQMSFLAKTAPRFVSPDYPIFNITRFSSNAQDIARWDPSDSPGLEASPVFVVGFPRSGTTLLEQALDAHPLLESMDEQPFLQNAIDNMRSLGVAYPEQLATLTPAACAQVRARYWELVRSKLALAPGQRLVDKNPLNMLRLPAIRRLFPQARIILAIRHPLDVLTSNYMQHYRAPEIAVMCSGLGRLAEGYRRAFDFWYEQATLLAPPVLELVYEDFVSDFERHVRRIAAFLDLPWNDAMLRPAEQALKKGYISAPSYSQVVQPVNRRAVGRWRHYEKHFATVQPVVAPYLRRWNYDADAGAA